MKATEKQELKKKIVRLGLFLLIVFLPTLVVSIVLAYKANVPQWLNILVLVLMLFVLYFLYVFICGKLDNRKNKRLKQKKDPFSD